MNLIEIPSDVVRIPTQRLMYFFPDGLCKERITTVDFDRQLMLIVGHVTGIPARQVVSGDDIHNVIAVWRCRNCWKLFICADIKDLWHECCEAVELRGAA